MIITLIITQRRECNYVCNELHHLIGVTPGVTLSVGLVCVDRALLGEPSDDEDDGDDSDGESDGGLDFLERLGGGGDPYLDDDGDGVFDPGDCDY